MWLLGRHRVVAQVIHEPHFIRGSRAAARAYLNRTALVAHNCDEASCARDPALGMTDLIAALALFAGTGACCTERHSAPDLSL